MRTSNIAREAALAAGIPDTVPAHTVTMACISSNAAIADCAAHIMSGRGDIMVAGGAETMSDVPIRFSRSMRKRFLAAMKVRKPQEYLKLLRGLKPKDLAPEAPAIAEFSTGETMGHSSDRLAARWGVTRDAQDEYALRSHHKAAKAQEAGLLDAEVVAVDGVTRDNGVRGDAKLEKLASLKPAFVRPHGTHTAGNSSFLTDGGAACLLMSGSKAAQSGYAPKSVLRDWIFVSQDPKEELLLGPAYAIARLLHRQGLKLDDVGVVELHEAFAGQVLSNLNALKDRDFCTRKARVADVVGELDHERLNKWGGALAIGHPFGATGTRLVTTASNRLIAENQRFALVSACAAGGQGVAMLLERA